MTTEEWDEIFPSTPEDIKQEIIKKLKDMWAEIGGDEEQLLKLIKNDISDNHKGQYELSGDKVDNPDPGVS